MSTFLNYNRRATGFSLAELIIAIGVIATLAVLLFSEYGQLTRRAQIAGDISNLRQIATAFYAYLGENRYRLPAVMAPHQPDLSGPTYVHDVLVRQMGITADLRSTNPDRKALGVWLSPGDKRKSPYLSPLSSYTVNYYAGEIYTNNDSTTAIYYHEVNNPSHKLYFLPGEGNASNPESQARFSHLTRPITSDDAAGTFGIRFYSGGKTPALWMDGHVSVMTKEYLRRNAMALIYPKIAPPTEME